MILCFHDKKSQASERLNATHPEKKLIWISAMGVPMDDAEIRDLAADLLAIADDGQASASEPEPEPDKDK